MRANDLIIIEESITTDNFCVFFGNISRGDLFRHGAEM